MHVLIALLLFILVLHLVPWVGRVLGCIGWIIFILIIVAIVCH
jgi:hypothetical protein